MRSALLGNKAGAQSDLFCATHVGLYLPQWERWGSGQAFNVLLVYIKPGVGFTGIHWLSKPVSFSENIHNVKPQAEFSICCKHSHSESKNSPLWCMACQRLLLRVAERRREAGKEQSKRERDTERERETRERTEGAQDWERVKDREREIQREREKRDFKVNQHP